MVASVDLEVGSSVGPPHHVPGHAGVHPPVPLPHTLYGVDVGGARGGGRLKHGSEFVSGARIITGIMPHTNGATIIGCKSIQRQIMVVNNKSWEGCAVLTKLSRGNNSIWIFQADFILLMLLSRPDCD